MPGPPPRRRRRPGWRGCVDRRRPDEHARRPARPDTPAWSGGRAPLQSGTRRAAGQSGASLTRLALPLPVTDRVHDQPRFHPGAEARRGPRAHVDSDHHASSSVLSQTVPACYLANLRGGACQSSELRKEDVRCRTESKLTTMAGSISAHWSPMNSAGRSGGSGAMPIGYSGAGTVRSTSCSGSSASLAPAPGGAGGAAGRNGPVASGGAGGDRRRAAGLVIGGTGVLGGVRPGHPAPRAAGAPAAGRCSRWRWGLEGHGGLGLGAGRAACGDANRHTAGRRAAAGERGDWPMERDYARCRRGAGGGARACRRRRR